MPGLLLLWGKWNPNTKSILSYWYSPQGDKWTSEATQCKQKLNISLMFYAPIRSTLSVLLEKSFPTSLLLTFIVFQSSSYETCVHLLWSKNNVNHWGQWVVINSVMTWHVVKHIVGKLWFHRIRLLGDVISLDLSFEGSINLISQHYLKSTDSSWLNSVVIG